MRYNLLNNFHNTEWIGRVRLDGSGEAVISRRTIERIKAQLCGCPDCCCGDYAGVTPGGRFRLEYVHEGPGGRVIGAKVHDRFRPQLDFGR